MAANQLRAPIALGFPVAMIANPQTITLSAAATWLAFQFVAEQGKTLNEARLFMAAKTGTLATTDLTCDLYGDASGVPGTSIESRPADAAGASGTWVNWSGFTTALSAGTAYWLVFKNANGTPASNNPNYQWVYNATSSTAGLPLYAGQFNNAAPMWGFNKVHSTNSGTAWATSPQSSVCGPRLKYADGTYDGFPAQADSRPSSGTTGDRAFGKQEVGNWFNLDAGVKYNVKGVWFPLIRTGSPGNLRFRLYQGTTLLGTSNAIPTANVTTSAGDGYAAYFASPITLDPASNPFCAVFGDATSADTNAAGYNAPVYTFENDANSLLLKPMGGSVKKVVIADNTAVSLTTTATDFLPFALLLDSNGPFTSGGGSPSVPPPAIRANSWHFIG